MKSKTSESAHCSSEKTSSNAVKLPGCQGCMPQLLHQSCLPAVLEHSNVKVSGLQGHQTFCCQNFTLSGLYVSLSTSRLSARCVWTSCCQGLWWSGKSDTMLSSFHVIRCIRLIFAISSNECWQLFQGLLDADNGGVLAHVHAEPATHTGAC